jgi:[acyl-carrier-protein] S-malonyltransferase
MMMKNKIKTTITNRYLTTKPSTSLQLFPGQGCQRLQMGYSLYSNNGDIIKQMFNRVDEILNKDFPQGFFHGFIWNSETTSNQIMETDIAQPLILTCSVIDFLITNQNNNNNNNSNKIAIGHSLGEYSALVATHSLSFTDAIKLVRFRGLAMKEACKNNPDYNTMIAMIGLSVENATKIHQQARKEQRQCEFAVSNGPNQQVFSGSKIDLQWASQLASSQYQVKRTLKLPVNSPFHTSIMKPVAKELQTQLEHIRIQSPQLFPIIFNSTATILTHPDDIRNALVRGIYETVRFTECVENATMDEGICYFHEYVGGGGLPVLSKILLNWDTTRSKQKFMEEIIT